MFARCLIAAAASAATAHAGILESATFSANVAASASITDAGGTLDDQDSTFLNELPASADFAAGVDLLDGSFSYASASLAASLANGVLTASGSVSSDVDNADAAIGGVASASSGFTLTFTIEEGDARIWCLDGFAGGVHADAGVSLSSASELLFSSSEDEDSDWTNNGTIIGPGTYTLSAGTSAGSDLDFFNGLFADASFALTFTLKPVPAPGTAALVAAGALVVARRRR